MNNPNQHGNFNRPPPSMSQQKVPLRKSVTLMRFLMFGAGYGCIDLISKFAFGEGKHLEYTRKQVGQLKQPLEVVEFPREKLIERLKDNEQLDRFQNEFDETYVTDTVMKNFIYGFIASHFGQVFHYKLNAFFQKKQYKSNKKMFLSPFSFLPYYLFCGIYDRLPVDQLASRIATDAIPLFIVRIIGDLARHNLFQKQEQQNLKAGKAPINNRALVVIHTLSKGLYVFAMDTLYHKRVQLF